MLTRITVDDVHDIAVGAAILGTGGGGDPWLGELMATRALTEHGPVQLVNPETIADDGLIVPIGGMGAPTVVVEKLLSGDELGVALAVLEREMGRQADAVCPFEAGGTNSLYAVIASAELGRPLLDVDGMGRAFPELQMVTFNVGGVSATPMVVVDERGSSVLIRTVTGQWAEKLARAATIAMGGHSMWAGYAMSGRDMKRVAIRGTISLAHRLGVAVRAAHVMGRPAVSEVLDILHGSVLFQGKIVDVQRSTTGGFARGHARIDGLDAYRGSQMIVDFQNEHLVASRDDQVLATVPDLIIVLDATTADPITTESLRYGARVCVVGSACHALWRSPAGLAICGPAAFGYAHEYVPVEQRVRV